MPITEILQKNADFYPADISLVEINPEKENHGRNNDEHPADVCAADR